MCDFCELSNFPKKNKDEYELVFADYSDLQIGITYNPSMNQWYFNTIIKEMGLEHKLLINYCPFCGKALNEDVIQ